MPDSGSRAFFQVVIPTLDEREALPALVHDLREWDPGLQLIVADGGSSDGTRTLAREAGCRVLWTGPGRARQMNAGAGVVTAPWILFVHADCRIAPAALAAAQAHLTRQPHRAGFFGLRIRHPGWIFRVIESGQRWRQRLLGLAYGDQGLLISRALFREVGGFPDEPLMEDVLIVRRLMRAGRLSELPARIETSPRRYLSNGPVRQTARNAWNLARFLLGTAPGTLASSYPPRRAATGRPPSRIGRSPLPRNEGKEVGPGGESTVLLFAKAPRPGLVKTRLARDIGEVGALRVYRHLVRQTVREASATGARVVLCYAPEDGRPELEALAAPHRLEFVHQGPGDLGARMERTLRAALGHGGTALVVGTDVPALNSEILTRAHRALEEVDLVLGPALDGGYYLLGLKRPAPALFHDMTWSTSQVLSETRDRALGEGLAVMELEPLKDVDTVADLTDELRTVAESDG
ncbi:MAG: TIGR04283 family arsenosugar biosynthesis glycosyltransferase [Gemmatimonadota bacterium]|nr:TIGR04283 family arsenosugar biosynthesis glycosyltransferase [Gemmatimonadota bacterium]